MLNESLYNAASLNKMLLVCSSFLAKECLDYNQDWRESENKDYKPE